MCCGDDCIMEGAKTNFKQKRGNSYTPSLNGGPYFSVVSLSIHLSSLKTEWFTSIEFPFKNEAEKAYLHVYERMTLRFAIHERALNAIQVNMNILCWVTNKEKVKKTCEEIRRRKPDVSYFLSSWSLNLATKPSCFL